MTQTVEQLPPANIEAEEAILGGILLDPRAIVIAKDILPASAFYVGAHQEIYEACLELSNTNNPTDLLAVSSYLSDRNLLDKVGGMVKLSQLLNRTVSAVNIDRYCQLVLNKSISRNLIRTGHEIVDLGYNQVESVEEALAQSQRKVQEVASQCFTSQMESNLEVSVRAFEDLGLENPIYQSGLKTLDRMLIGFEPGTLTLLAGRPSMGKSAISLSFAFKHMIQYKLPVAFFSLEMTKKQLEYRLWSQMSVQSFYKHHGVKAISGDRLRKHRGGIEPLTQQELDDIALVANLAGQLPLYINDDRKSTVASIGANCRQLKNQVGRLGLVIVDYLQMMSDGASDNRSYELGAIARALYQLSSEIDVPVIALSQVNRAVETRQDKRPTMADLSQSGILEMVADNIIFAYRDEYYFEGSHDHNVLELILRKARHGSTGTAKVFFDKEYGQIEDLY